MTENLVGKRLGKYEIQAEIGKGGMGMVYRGYDPLLDRQVAIKVLAPHLVWEPGFIERFLREARAAARLKHAGIVTIYDVGQEGNWYYIVMEYLEGRTLAQVIREQGALQARQALAILHPLAEALDYAHQYGLVHRDVKPANIVVNSAGQVTLTDFGVARAAQETRLTTTGALIGTPQYMSPEQAQGEEVDHRTDIYSLGVVAYEMLVGRAPFAATTPHAVLHQLIYDPPPPVQRSRPDLPPEVDQVLGRALAKKSTDRYETAAGFVAALGQVLPGKDQGADVRPKPAKAVPQKASSPARARRRASWDWTVWLGWLLVSAVGWAVGWAVGRPVAEAVAWPIGENVGLLPAEMVGGATANGLTGLVLGILQWLVLRRAPPIRKAGWWVLASLTGWAVIGSIKWGQGMAMDAILFEAQGWLEAMGWAMADVLIGTGFTMVFEAVTGLVIGTAQWLVLQGQVSKAGRWVLISVVAWAANPPLISILGWASGEPSEETMMWLFNILGGIVPAAITATGLVWLLTRSRRDAGSDRQGLGAIPHH